MLKLKSADAEQLGSSRLEAPMQIPSKRSVYLPYILIAIFVAVGILPRLSEYPLPWFDEGYTTHVAHLVIEKGVYGTYNGERLYPFDPFVSSGPGVVLPIVFMFKTFGDGILQARLALFPYTVLFGWALYSIARYIYGQTMAFLTVVGVLAALQLYSNLSINAFDVSPLMIGRQVLGEIPALSVIFLGLMVWFKSWDRHSLLLSILAGAICGFGVLSKMQTVFGLGPALFFIALFRTFKNRRDIALYFVPVVVVVLCIVGWMGFQRLSTPAELRPEYANITTLAVIVHYLIGLFGRVLERRETVVCVVLALLIMLRLAVLAYRSRKDVSITNHQWAELTVIAFALFYLLWYFSLSVGWERYLFPAFILICLFVVKLVQEAIAALFPKLQRQWSTGLEQRKSNLYMIVFTTVVVALIAATTMIWVDPDINNAQLVSDYIRTSIPKDAMIESWEWELDAPSDHLNVHHPDSTYVIKSIWDLAMHQPLVLEYDMLQANPDYLITGRFNNLTNIYKADELDQHFELIQDFGLYNIYKRK